jgi:DNA-binding SARP family transcriptional activator
MDATKTSRRALLAGTPVVAAAAMVAGTTVALAIPRTADVDPIFAAIERHREAMELEEAAHERFEALSAESDPDDFLEWPLEQRRAWRDEQAKRLEESPRNVAYDVWNDLYNVRSAITAELGTTTPTTTAGLAALLQHWADIVGDDEGNFDNYDTTKLLTALAGGLRGQA